MTEFLGPGMTCECEIRDGMHAWADAFLVECIHPETGSQLRMVKMVNWYGHGLPPMEPR